MADRYKTIISHSEGIYKDKGSKFLSFAYPINNKEEVKPLIEKYRKQHHSARHHCYAYQVGVGDRSYYRVNDDGEPSGTGGKPILGQILSFGLTDIVIIVVRYFGGTLLGVSGLIQAYKNAAADAIATAEIIEKEIKTGLHITFEYTSMNKVMKLINDFDAEIDHKVFNEKCAMKLAVGQSKAKAMASKLKLVENLIQHDAPIDS